MGGAAINSDELKLVDRVERIELARKIGQFLSGNQQGQDRATGEDLARMLAADTSVAVREALALELRNSSVLPADLVERIARDLDQVAVPFLIAAKALTDDLLEQIVRECGDAAQEAIARRDGVSEPVSYAICDVAREPAVTTLFANPGAEISERTCHRATDRFPDSQSLLQVMAARADLPLSVAESVIERVSDVVAERLVKHYQLGEDLASYLLGSAKRRVFSDTMEAAPTEEVLAYLKRLHRVGALTSDYLLQAIQMGHLRTFRIILALLADAPMEKVTRDLEQRGRMALDRLLKQADLSQSVAGVIVIAYERQVEEAVNGRAGKPH